MPSSVLRYEFLKQKKLTALLCKIEGTETQSVTNDLPV